MVEPRPVDRPTSTDMQGPWSTAPSVSALVQMVRSSTGSRRCPRTSTVSGRSNHIESQLRYIVVPLYPRYVTHMKERIQRCIWQDTVL